MSEEAEVSQLLAESQEFFKQRRFQEALVALDQALALDSNNVAAWSLKGLALEHLDRYEEASVLLRGSHQARPHLR